MGSRRTLGLAVMLALLAVGLWVGNMRVADHVSVRESQIGAERELSGSLPITPSERARTFGLDPTIPATIVGMLLILAFVLAAVTLARARRSRRRRSHSGG